MSSKGTVLITGLNGYLAGRVAEAALQSGYNVRGTVRNLASGTEVHKTLLDRGFSKGAEVVQVSDITVPGAFDEAVVGCSAIIHIASPLSDIWTLDPSEVVRMNVESTTGILESASKAGPQLKSVVLMSSSAAIIDVPIKARVYSEKDWNPDSEAAVEQLGREAGGLHAYCASKTAGEKAFWRFRDERKPAFGMTAIQATYFIGPPLVPWKTKERIPACLSHVWKLLQGEDIPEPMLFYESTIDVRDVASVMVWSASNPKEADGERFLCSSFTGGPQAVADVLNKHMPELGVAKGSPGKGYKPDYTAVEGTPAFDSTKVVRATGKDWTPYENSVVDTAKVLIQYLKQ